MLLQKYSNKYEKAKLERTKINAFNTALKTFKRKYSERQTDQQNRHNAFSEEKKILAENIANLIKTRNSLTPYECLIEETEVEPEVNPVDAFLFVSKIAIEKIDNAYFEEILKGSLKKGNRIQVEEITREDLRKMISRYPTEIDDPLETNHEIGKIAGMVGYDNASKFSNSFKSIMGINPSEYKKSV